MRSSTARGAQRRRCCRGRGGELRGRHHGRVHRADRRRRDAPSRAGDTAIFFNFRPDRARQLTRLLLDNDFDVTTMTRYACDLDTPVAFAEQDVPARSPRCSPRTACRQLHVAETEKYAHVTYFFNGGREEAWPGETRMLVPSPRDVPSYDLKPAMSADEVADRVVGEIGDGYAYCVVNFANPDMVGHTGSIPASIAAVETADRCLGRVVDARRASSAASASSPPTTATPSRCSRPTGSARTPHTRRTRCR